MIRPPPRSTRTVPLFPYTTLFRSGEFVDVGAAPIGADLDFRYPLRAKRPLYQRQHGVDGGRERRRFVVRACPVLLLRALAEMVPDVLIQFPIRPARLLHPLQEGAQGRSEEHTSELQSLMRISYAVFCLKKKKKKRTKQLHIDEI